MKTIDLSCAATERRMAYLEQSQYWDAMTQAAGVISGATDAQTKELLAALDARVAFDLATRQITVADDEALGGLLSLIGVVGGLVRREIGLERGVDAVIPNTRDRVYVLSEDLQRIPLVGWRVCADGTATPIPAAKPPGRWAVVDDLHATGVWSDGTVVNIGLVEHELGKRPEEAPHEQR